jgi:hypothetical protein
MWKMAPRKPFANWWSATCRWSILRRHEGSAVTPTWRRTWLNEAINQLGELDRTAIVLRFLQQQDLYSVGKALGITDDAAQKRKMMAVMQMNTKPIIAARVVSQDAIDADRVVIHTQWQYSDGQVGQNDWSLHRDTDGWRVIISAGLVEKLRKGFRLGGLTTAAAPQP